MRDLQLVLISNLNYNFYHQALDFPLEQLKYFYINFEDYHRHLETAVGLIS